jgi:carboxyl-terminal processing protease
MKLNRGFSLWLVAWITLTLGFILLWDRVYKLSTIVDRSDSDGAAMENILDIASQTSFTASEWVIQTHPDPYYLRKFSELFSLVDELYYRSDDLPLDKDAMYESAFKGFINGLGDVYTTYMTATENTKFTVDMEGSKEFFGIWAAIQKTSDGIKIDEVYKWSPAFVSWLEPLDVIVEIDGQSTLSMNVNEAVDLIRWPKWTTVTLAVRKHFSNELVELTVTRDTITIPSVRASLLPLWTGSEKRALYIELSIFGDDTVDVLHRALDDVLVWGATYDALIVDVRGNWGWYLPKAIEIASYFLPKGVLVTTARYNAFQDETFLSMGKDRLVSRPTVVLLDRMSASASEIVAAALRDHIWAVLVGTQTFGKWSIQSLHDLPDGSSLKITIGNRYTPSDISVTGIGLTPDIIIPFDKEAFGMGVDSQLHAALDYLLTNIP